jgi:hypothetical protein
LGQVLNQVDRDREIWIEWVSGRRQADIAADRGLAQSSVSEAISRYRSTLPPLDRAEELDRSLDLVNELIESWKPKAATNLGAARMVDRLVNTKAKLAGLVTTKVQHEGQVDHAHVIDPGPNLTELMNQWISEGRVRVKGELVRLDA